MIRDASSISLRRRQLVLQNALVKKSDVKKLPKRLTLAKVDVII